MIFFVEVSKRTMNSLILSTLILIFEFVPVEFYSWPVIVAAAILILIVRPKFFFSSSNPVVPLLIVLITGFAFASSNPILSVAKDLWYLAKPIAIISLGIMIAYMSKTDRRWVAHLAVVVIIVSIANMFESVSFEQAEDPIARPTSFIAAFAGPFIWKYYPSRSVSGLIFRVVVILVVIAMIVLSQSRASILTFGVAWLAAYGALQNSSRAVFVFGFLVFAITVFFPLLPQYDFGGQRFLAKLQNSINEIMFESGETRVSMYRNWRGFEAYQAYKMWLDATLWQKLVGFGHGSEIYLGRMVTFLGHDVESIHSIHNSYFGLLVKTGLLGVVAYLAFLFRPFSSKTRASNAAMEIYSRIVRGGALALLFTSALVSGPFNKSGLDGLLLIWSAAYGLLLLQAQKSRRRVHEARIRNPAQMGRLEGAAGKA